MRSRPSQSASARARGPAPPPAGPRAPETRARDCACAGARRRFLGTRARRNPGSGDSAPEARRAAGFPPREAEELHFSALAAPKVEAAPGPGYGASSPPQPAPCAARSLEALRSSEVFHLGRGKVLNLLRVVGWWQPKWPSPRASAEEVRREEESMSGCRGVAREQPYSNEDPAQPQINRNNFLNTLRKKTRKKESCLDKSPEL